MKSFREIVEAAHTGADDLLKLQQYFNKYKFNIDTGNDSQAKKFLVKVKTYYKKVQAKDDKSTSANGELWSTKLKGVI